MSQARSYPRRGWVPALFVLLGVGVLALEIPRVWAAEKSERKAAGPPSFARERNPVLRRGLYEQWKAQQRRVAAPLSSRKIAAPLVTSTVGRPSMVVNASGTTLFTKQFPPNSCDVDPGSCGPPDGTSCTTWTATTAFALGKVVRSNGFQMYALLFQAQNAGTSGATEPLWPAVAGGNVVDGTITWLAIGYDPAMFTGGCTAMQLVSRSSGGVETVLATEGDVLTGGQLSGWGEFVAFNDSGLAAFKADQTGVLTEGDETSVGLFRAGPGAGALTRLAQYKDVIGGRKIMGISPMVAINNAGQILFDGYAAIPRPTWQPNTLYTGGTIIPTAPTPNDLEFFLSISGTSGAVEPVWPTLPGKTIADGTAQWIGRVRDGNQDDHGIIRFTPGTGNELLFANGTLVGGGFSVFGFGEVECGTCDYGNIDPFLNTLGHTSTAVTLANPIERKAGLARKQGLPLLQTAAYLLTGPGVFTQVARTGAPGPGGNFGVIHSRTVLNNCDQVVFKAQSPAPTDKVIRWTPPSTYAVVAAIGDDIGTRSGGSASGDTILNLGFFFDINNLGNVVFQATLTLVSGGTAQSYLFWDGTTGLLSEIVRTPTRPVNLAAEMVTLNDCNTVAFTSGAKPNEDLDAGSELDETGLHTWTKLGGIVDVIKVGDIIGGDTVSSVNAQHHSFARRQLGPSGCVAVNYFVNGVSGGNTEDAGEGSGLPGVNGGVPPAGQLLVVCPPTPCVGLICGPLPPPTATPTGTLPPTATPTPTQTLVPSATQTSSGAAVQVPMLGGWALAFLGLLLAATGLLFVRSR